MTADYRQMVKDLIRAVHLEGLAVPMPIPHFDERKQEEPEYPEGFEAAFAACAAEVSQELSEVGISPVILQDDVSAPA